MANIVVNLARPGTGDDNFYNRWKAFGTVVSHVPQDPRICKKVTLLVVDQYTTVDAKFIKQFENLRCIATPTTGLTHIQEGLRIHVVSLNSERTFLNRITSVAEFTIWKMLELAKYVSDPPQKIAGKTLGIVGMGRLGTMVKNRAKSMGMSILHYEKDMDPQALNYLMARSDFISIHCDENPTSKCLINKKRIALMWPTAFLINTARASIIDEKALLQVLEFGHIAGAALDTSNLHFDLYNPQPKTLLMTGHTAGRSIEDRIATCEFL